MFGKNSLLLFLKLSYLGAITLFILEFLTYQGVLRNNLGISPFVLVAVIAASHLGIRFWRKLTLPESFARVQYFILMPLSLFFALSALVLEEYGFLFPNYFFVNFKMHYPVLLSLGIVSGVFGLIHTTKQQWKDLGKPVFFLISFLFTIAAVVLFYLEPEIYQQHAAEDGTVENLTCLVFFLGSVVSALTARKVQKLKISVSLKRILVVLFALAGVGLFLVAAEEISWGQRIFQIRTPDSVAEGNRQGEINLHNSEFFWPYVYLGYGAIAAFGAFAWIVVWLVAEQLEKHPKIAAWTHLLTPRPYLFFSFFVMVIYVWLRRNHGPWKYVAWEEVSELWLALGILLHLWETYQRLPKMVASYVKKGKK